MEPVIRRFMQSLQLGVEFVARHIGQPIADIFDEHTLVRCAARVDNGLLDALGERATRRGSEHVLLSLPVAKKPFVLQIAISAAQWLSRRSGDPVSIRNRLDAFD